MQRFAWLLTAAAIALLATQSISCGGVRHSNLSFHPHDERSPLADRLVDPPDPDPETLASLSQQLEAELARLGKTTASMGGAPTSGNEVHDLRAAALDPDENGPLPPYGVSVRWTEVLRGDYDQNGEVNGADLVPLARYFGYTVVYDDPTLHDGRRGVPSGDPADYGITEAGQPPAADSGAFNWRLARIDGDGNGEINAADIAPIARYWGESLSGYVLYRQGPQDPGFTPVPNPADPSSPLTVRRAEALAGMSEEQKRTAPVFYAQPDFFFLDPPNPVAEYSYKIAPYSIPVQSIGVETGPISLRPFGTSLLNGGVIPRLEVEVIDQSDQSPEPERITGTAPLRIRLDASQSYVPGGKVANYLWDLDGDRIYERATSGVAELEHNFTQNGRFAVSVRVMALDDPATKNSSLIRSSSALDIGATATVEVVVLNAAGNVPPVAVLKANRNVGPAPLSVTFDASASSDSDGTIVVYEWDFDEDGKTDYSSSSPSATYTFGTSAFTNVAVKVIDNDGAFHRATLPVSTSNANGNWPPVAALTVSPSSGPSPLNVTLSAQGSVDPDGRIVKYEWDINGDFNFDLDSGAQSELDYTFTQSGIFNVWLRTTDSGGEYDLARALVSVNTAPFGGIVATPASGPGPLSVAFDASASQDLDGTIVNYKWDFTSDGIYDLDTGIVPRANKTFYQIGRHTVTLLLTDNLGATETVRTTVEVNSPQANLAPTVLLSASATSGANPLSVTFTATASDPDVGGGIDHLEWDFNGDGIYEQTSPPAQNVKTHVFSAQGRYKVSVRAVDILGGAAHDSVEIVAASGGNVPPLASFTVTPPSASPGTTILFNGSASSDANDAIVKYEWDFEGDGIFDETGGPATHRLISRVFNDLGSYHVILRVTDGVGAISTYYETFISGEVPTLTVISDRSYAEVPNAVFNLDASRSTGNQGAITQFEWDFDGNGSYELQTGVSPFATAKYELQDLAGLVNGEVTPRVRATNEIGASVTTSIIMRQALDASGQPVRDLDGNLVLGPDGLPLLEPVQLKLYDNYDEIEDNTLDAPNMLVGPGPGGAFRPLAAPGDSIVSLRAAQAGSTPLTLTRTDPANPGLGPYVAGSLGERNLGLRYDGDDEDWYAFTLADGAEVTVDLKYDNHSSTNLDLRLYDTDRQTALAQSAGSVDEKLTYIFRDAGTFFLRINRFVGEGQDYRLWLNTRPIPYFPENTGGDTDNSSMASADDLQATIITPKLPYAWGRLTPGMDSEDWYSFQYNGAITTRVRAEFTHRVGDIDLYLYSASGMLLGFANSSDNNETLWAQLPEGAPGVKTVYVRVVAFSGSAVNYTLSVGYPAGQPLNLVAANNGDFDGKIDLSWDAPAPGGNTPNGYDVYVSDEELGIYTKLAGGLTSRTFTHNLSATPEKLNQKYWYKVKATIVGQLDSTFSNTAMGFSNGIKPAVNLVASDEEYLDRIAVRFDSAPHDPSLGIGNFGVPPQLYNVYADPDDSQGVKPRTLIKTFGPGDGTAVQITFGSGTRAAERYSFDWQGAPEWTSAQLKGLNVNFTVEASAVGYSTVATPVEGGGIAALQAPSSFSATKGTFADKVRLSWSAPGGAVEPTGYVISYKGLYDSGWTKLTNDPLPHEPGETSFDHYVTEPGGSPPVRHYRIRCFREGFGYSPWVDINGTLGYAANNAFSTPVFQREFLGNTMIFHVQPHGSAGFKPRWVKLEMNMGSSPSIATGWKAWSEDLISVRSFHDFTITDKSDAWRRYRVVFAYDVPGFISDPNWVSSGSNFYGNPPQDEQDTIYRQATQEAFGSL